MFKIKNWSDHFWSNQKTWWPIAILILFAFNPAIQAQEETGDEPPQKERVRMSITTTQYPGDTIELSALVRAKIEGIYQKIEGVDIEFFAIGAEDEIALGQSTTNATGIASLRIDGKSIEKNEEGYMTFAARFDGNDELKAGDDEVAILKASLVMTPVREDSTLTVNISVSAVGEEGMVPLADADIALFVKRMIGRLKVGEETTDENGEASIEFPTDLPGDDQGNLYITAFIEDYGEYGNLAATTTQTWGIPVSYAIEDLPRSLWSPNPPIWMVITFFVLMAAVWGHYVLIASRLFKMKKLE